MRRDELTVLASVENISLRQLRSWVRKGWVRPVKDRQREVFTDTDIARVRLICHLKHDLRITDDAIPVVLSLMDQVYGLRREMRILGKAIEQQPRDIQRAISAAVRSLSRW